MAISRVEANPLLCASIQLQNEVLASRHIYIYIYTQNVTQMDLVYPTTSVPHKSVG